VLSEVMPIERIKRERDEWLEMLRQGAVLRSLEKHQRVRLWVASIRRGNRVGE